MLTKWLYTKSYHNILSPWQMEVISNTNGSNWQSYVSHEIRRNCSTNAKFVSKHQLLTNCNLAASNNKYSSSDLSSIILFPLV